LNGNAEQRTRQLDCLYQWRHELDQRSDRSCVPPEWWSLLPVGSRVPREADGTCPDATD
jgi:hypothetical protein